MASHISRRLCAAALGEHADRLPDVSIIDILLNDALPGLQLDEALTLFNPGNIVIQFRGWSAGTLRILEDVQRVVPDLFDQIHRLAKIVVRLPREADNNITSNCNPALCFFDAFNFLQVLRRCMATAHRAQNFIASGLHRKVYPLAEILMFINRRHNVGMKIAGKGGGELDALHSRGRDGPQQTAERCGTRKSFESVLGPRAIAVDVLADQMNFAIAEVPQLFNFPDYV